MAVGENGLLLPPTEVNDTHKKWDVTIFIIILLIVTVLMTVARLVLRWRSQTFGWDDWAMIPALLAYTAHSILGAYVNARAGIGKPLWEVTEPEFELWLKGIAISAFLYPASSGLIRLSILLFYDRVFSKANKTMRFATRITIVLTVIYIITFQIYSGFLCKPLRKFWKPFERAKYCGPNVLYWIFNSCVYAYSLVLDLTLLLLPIFPVMKLQLSTKKKVGAIAMFVIGASACVAATYKLTVFGLQWGRMAYIDPRWASMELSRVIPPQFDIYGYTMWIPTQAEISAAIIGSSLIALKPYLQRIMQRFSKAFVSIATSLGKSGKSESTSALRQSQHSTDRYVRIQDKHRDVLATDFELTRIETRV